MIRAIGVIELVFGLMLTGGAIVLFANAHFCWFGGKGCGIWEPIFAEYLLAISIPLTLAGFFHHKQKRLAGTLALAPAAFVVVVLVGQAQNWW